MVSPKKQTRRAAKDKSYAGKINHQVSLARNRIGGTRTDQLAWLLEFAYSDLDTLSEGRLTDIGWEFVAFGLPESEDRPMHMDAYADVGSDTVRPDAGVMRRFHAKIKAGFDAFFHGEGWQIERPRVVERIKLGDSPFRFAGFEEDIHARILYSFDLCKDELGRLGLCRNPQCGRPFVTKKKGRGLFCSPRCSAYVRVTFSRAKDRIQARSDYAKLTVLEIQSKLRAALRPRKKRTN